MLITIIIVNYNVRYFLEHCLLSVMAARERLKNQQVEVIVVDNGSSDSSVSFLQHHFPEVLFIESKENLGFAGGNTLGLKHAQGKYILFLNPDTVVPEDILVQTIGFMEKHQDAGALGVRMVDGCGLFLQESKRGFPTIWAAACKMTGLAKVFPRSAFFARYYLGHLDEESNHKVEALAGAFMLCKKEVLDKTGAFDERFFMYAEDIDLSYRIHKAGFQNYYLGSTSILHFKGESTRKDFRYVRLFYKAMNQFVVKHYSGFFAIMLRILLQFSIGLMALLSAAQKFFLYFFQSKPIKNPRIAFKGDSDAQAIAFSLLQEKKEYRFISANENPDIMVFCQGPTFSFQDLISYLQTSGFLVAAIHSTGSRSVVLSPDRNQQGEIMVKKD